MITQYVGGGTTNTTYYRRAAKYVRVGGLTTARTLTIGSSGKTFDGTANVSWSLSEIGAAAASHTHSYLPLSGGTLTGDLDITESSMYPRLAIRSVYNNVTRLGTLECSTYGNVSIQSYTTTDSNNRRML